MVGLSVRCGLYATCHELSMSAVLATPGQELPVTTLFRRVSDRRPKSCAKAKKSRQRIFACFLSINKSIEVIQPRDVKLQLFLTL